MARKRVGLLLSGCCVQDGAEIHESVLTLLALDRADVEVVFLAPNIEQCKVTNHATGKELPRSATSSSSQRASLAERSKILRRCGPRTSTASHYPVALGRR